MTAADLSRVDVSTEERIRRIDELTALKRARFAVGMAAEERHQCDSDDSRFALLPCPHPEACSTAADYPGFDAWITQQQNLNTAARRTR
ncbi:hypothetical protein EES43_24205 [Streptomyces sp. ADI96-02]|uniref:hypothetical protein n=1 Tax=Streptomyces sp. ADI96-02 TaxID=1522760 RepID=UPI000F54EE8A|nr:hypothetical protein [Streptomyces sp. ADI96-02]RPK56147.1 hypothetical protein EES43_24205 [Streptomyces sp. ADI96-02]